MSKNPAKLSHPQIMSRVLNRPLLLESRYSRTFLNALASSGDTSVNFVDGAGAMMGIDDAPQRSSKAYGVVNGVAILPVSGTLLHKYGHVQPYSGCTGYDGIKSRLMSAAADPDIHTIMLDLDSPGGEVSGCQELAKVIAGMDKPVVAYVDELAASAAYWIASSCDMIVGPESANVGSIGVVWMHTDVSQALDKQGINVTFIHAGAHKVDGNPYEALSDDVRGAFQAEIDTLYSMFTASVAAGRPNMSELQVRQTEARVYLASDAVDIGLMDGIMSRSEFISFLSQSSRGAGSSLSAKSLSTFTLEKAGGNFKSENFKGSNMSDAAVETPLTQADLDAVAAQARADAIEEYKLEVAAAAERSKAIFSHEKASAEVKEMLASDAFASVEVGAVVALMDALPKGFTAMMDEEQGAGVEAEPQQFADDVQGDAAAKAAAAATALQNSKFSVI